MKRELPEGFEALEPFVCQWAIATMPGRDAMRARASAGERQAFYHAASRLLEPALDHLDRIALSSLNDNDERLMEIMLSLAHVALAEEVQREAEPEHSRLRSFMPFT